MTQHVFRASGLIDGVMVRGQQMSVSPSSIRAELLAACLPLFAEMRTLASSQFGKQTAFIVAAVDEYEDAIRTLAELGGGCIAEDRRNGIGTCPVCGTPITHLPKYQIVLCSGCDKAFMAAHSKLDSSEGFGTWCI